MKLTDWGWRLNSLEEIQIVRILNEGEHLQCRVTAQLSGNDPVECAYFLPTVIHERVESILRKWINQRVIDVLFNMWDARSQLVRRNWGLSEIWHLNNDTCAQQYHENIHNDTKRLPKGCHSEHHLIYLRPTWFYQGLLPDHGFFRDHSSLECHSLPRRPHFRRSRKC